MLIYGDATAGADLLLKANRLSDPTRIPEGTRLTVPRFRRRERWPAHTRVPHIGAEGEATLDTAVDTFDGFHVLDCFEAGTPFTFTFYRSEAAFPRGAVSAPARVGAPVIFRIDGILVFNGHIEELEEVVDRGGSGSGAHLVVKGRDLVGKARDWDADPATAFQA